MRKSLYTGIVTMTGPQLKISCLMFSDSDETQQSPMLYFSQVLVLSTHCSSVYSVAESQAAHLESTSPYILAQSRVRDTNPALQLELMTLSQKTGVWGDRSGYQTSLDLHQRSVIALMAAMEYEDEQFPWAKTGRAQLGYCSLKLQDQGTIVSLFPVLHLKSCCLFDAWAFIVRFASTNLYPLNIYVGPTVKVLPQALIAAMYSASLTSVVWTLGPDFQRELKTATRTKKIKIPKTMWQAYLSSRSSFFLERSAWPLRARSLASGSAWNSQGPSFFGDFDLTIILIIKARVKIIDKNISHVDLYQIIKIISSFQNQYVNSIFCHEDQQYN